MKKVFLSLAVIATLTVVSCKDKNAEAPETNVETEVVAPEVTVDTTVVAPTDTTAVEVAPAN